MTEVFSEFIEVEAHVRRYVTVTADPNGVFTSKTVTISATPNGRSSAARRREGE